MHYPVYAQDWPKMAITVLNKDADDKASAGKCARQPKIHIVVWDYP
jgi:hypothetical protein